MRPSLTRRHVACTEILFSARAKTRTASANHNKTRREKFNLQIFSRPMVLHVSPSGDNDGEIVGAIVRRKRVRGRTAVWLGLCDRILKDFPYRQ